MAIRIFIDQGHNPSGPNTGAEGNGLIEQDITYAVGLYLAELLSADPRFEVRLSRTSPGEILGTSKPRCPRAGGERLAGGLLHQYPLQRE